MHKGLKHKAMLRNCDKCDNPCTQDKVLVMHMFIMHGGQEELIHFDISTVTIKIGQLFFFITFKLLKKGLFDKGLI